MPILTCLLSLTATVWYQKEELECKVEAVKLENELIKNKKFEQKKSSNSLTFQELTVAYT